MNQYDKLGELLKEALENEEFLSDKKVSSNSNNINQKNNKQIKKNTEEQKTSNPLIVNLGLTAPATKQEIKDAYRKLLKKYHPDNIPKFPEMQKTAAKKTNEIVEAYKKLIAEFS